MRNRHKLCLNNKVIKSFQDLLQFAGLCTVQKTRQEFRFENVIAKEKKHIMAFDIMAFSFNSEMILVSLYAVPSRSARKLL